MFKFIQIYNIYFKVQNLIYNTMKHISKYNNFSINESVDIMSDKQDIIDIIVDIIDDDKYSLTLHSPTGRAIKGDEIHTGKSIEFIPVYKAGNIRRSKFSLSANLNKDKTYDGFIELLSEMGVVIKRLKDLGWNLTKLSTLSTTANPDMNVDCDMQNAIYTFEKPDIEEEDPNFKPSKEGIKDLFSNIGLFATNIEIKFVGGKTKWEIYIEFESLEYDGDLSPRSIDDKIADLCDRIGAASYDYEDGYDVTIYW